MLVIRMMWDNHCFIFHTQEDMDNFYNLNAEMLEGVEFSAEWVIL